MDQEKPRKRHTQFSRLARTKRILEQLREGWAYDDIAREEGISERRVRQIVTQFLKAREALEGATHAHMQIDRLGRAMRVASDALARGDIRAIGPFIRVIDRLDRYQTLVHENAAHPTPVEDQVVIQALVARLTHSAKAKESGREAPEAGGASIGSAALEPTGNSAAVAAPAVAEAEAPLASAPLSSQAPGDFFRRVRP